MNPEIESHSLADIAPPPGISVWLKFTGRLRSVDRVHYELGRYTCPHVIDKGRGWVQSGQVRKELGPGDMFCIMNDGEIEYYDDPENPWQYYWLHLCGETCDELVRAWGFTPEKPWMRPQEPERVSESFKNIHRLAGAQTQIRSNMIAAELFKLSDAICNSIPDVRKKGKGLVELARTLIEAQMHTGINVSELAEILNVNRTTLFQAFRRELNCSPVEFIRQQRIERACQLLNNSERKLTSIARICGFANDKYFSRTFRELKGMTPREFSRNR